VPKSAKKRHISKSLWVASLCSLGTTRRFCGSRRVSLDSADASQIFLPLEGMPASLGPGLRTVSGAKVSQFDGQRCDR
jgi:hypothetical protein